MSTRCNLILKYHDTTIYIYRHHDGYLSETGYDISTRLMNNLNINKFIRSLLNCDSDPSFTRDSNPTYEITTNIHGDIEYLYEITFPTFMGDTTNDNNISFKISKRGGSWNNPSWNILFESNTLDKDNIRQELDFINNERIKVLSR
tara:strand:+ start:9600 stop:10037 length:438 start_codon:yes stop_codon:yes gene_type:complete